MTKILRFLTPALILALSLSVPSFSLSSSSSRSPPLIVHHPGHDRRPLVLVSEPRGGFRERGPYAPLPPLEADALCFYEKVLT